MRGDRRRRLPLVPALERIGIHPNSVPLEGNVRTALRRLKARYPELGTDPKGYEIRKIRSRAELRAYVDILRAEFKRRPEYGWFVADPRFLRHLEETHLPFLRSGEPRVWIILHRGKVVGGIDYFLSARDPLRRASIGANLARSAQGKGLVKWLYRCVLEEFDEIGVLRFRGSTGHESILHLAEVMERKAVGMDLVSRARPWFRPGKFEPWLRRLVRNRFF